MRGLGPFLRDAWLLSRPYFRSEERWSARGLLAVIIALNLLMVGMTVVLNFWNGAFYNALQHKDWQAFLALLLWYRRDPAGFFGILPGFCEIVALYIVVAVYRVYLNQWLQIRWRRWMTQRFVDEWLDDRVYYRISLTARADGTGTDNPDQRISEDIRNFVTDTLSLGLDLLSNVVTMFSFLGILWTLSGPHHAARRAHSRLHGVGGAGLCGGRHLAHPPDRPAAGDAELPPAALRGGFPLRAGAPARERRRRGPLRRRDGGEAGAGQPLRQRDRELVGDHAADQEAQCADRRLFARWRSSSRSSSPRPATSPARSQLGGLMQIVDAFGQVQGSMSWFVNNYAALAVVARRRSNVSQPSTARSSPPAR